MSSKSVVVENLGPIPYFAFTPKGPGVTILNAPNGSGKSILLGAIQAAATGTGKLPLRDHTREGRVEAFGAVITIGGKCRHTGGFEVTNIEGKFDLAQLVDPQLKTPQAADAARIKALVSLTGVQASPELFRTHEAFQSSFDEVVRPESIETDDLVEMARRIKSDYDQAARVKEATSQRESGHAAALAPPADLDMDEESDRETLEAAYNEARDERTRLTTLEESARSSKAAREKAKQQLDGLAVDELKADKLAMEVRISSNDAEEEKNSLLITELQNQIAGLRNRNSVIVTETLNSKARIETIDRQLAIVADAMKTISSDDIIAPSDQSISEANEAVNLAAKAMERGVQIREALSNAVRAGLHRKASSDALRLAATYRDAGKATDDVLSSCIKCPQLRVESDGKNARLVTDATSRGKSIAYHELSEGQQWTLAIDIGADQVGDDGLLVISQRGWEGIDGANRVAIHEHALRRNVYILTAEKSLDPNATKEIIPTQFGEPVVPQNPPLAGSSPESRESAEQKPEKATRKKSQPKPKPAEPQEQQPFDIPF